jgi:hypothetical protein
LFHIWFADDGQTIRDAKLETRSARNRLAPSKKAHWKTLVPGKLHLGYRKKNRNEPGLWLARRYLGGERYRVAPLGLADDYADAASDTDVLSFADAQRLAHERRFEAEGRRSKSLTVADAINDYIAWMKIHRITAEGAARRAELHILPALGKFKVEDLTTSQLNSWRDALAVSPALLRSRPGTAQNAREPPRSDEQRRARRATANKIVTILLGLPQALTNENTFLFRGNERKRTGSLLA